MHSPVSYMHMALREDAWSHTDDKTHAPLPPLSSLPPPPLLLMSSLNVMTWPLAPPSFPL